MASSEFKINKLSKNCCLTVVITRQLRIRTFIFVRLVKLAAWILGSSVEIKHSNNDEVTSGNA